MYRFTDTVDRHTDYGLTVQTVYNGLNLEDLLSDEKGNFLTLSVFGRSDIANRVETYQVPGLDGLLEYEELTLGEREIVVSYKIKDETSTGLRKRIERLNSLLSSSKKQLAFTDESDVFYYATLLKNELPDEIENDTVGTLTFLCSDPFKYGSQKKALFQSSGVFDVVGSANAEPIIRVEMKDNATFVAVSDADGNINMIGEPSNISDSVYERETIMMHDSAATLTGWSQTGVMPDAGVIAGSFYSDGLKFKASDYGTGPAWHGPVMKKSFGGAIQDFVVEIGIENLNTYAYQMGRVEVYLLDDSNNVIAKMAMHDSYADTALNFGEIRAGNTETNHFIIAESGDYKWTWNNFKGVLRIARVGDYWEGYIAKVDADGKHDSGRFRTFTDTQKKFTGKLAQVQLHIGAYGIIGPSSMAVDYVKVSKINVQQGIPYIVKAGDVVEFNHDTNKITINNINALKHKAFIGEYFPLKKGRNTIVAEPASAIAATEVRWRDKWL